jgi:hypothetical protein
VDQVTKLNPAPSHAGHRGFQLHQKVSCKLKRFLQRSAFRVYLLRECTCLHRKIDNLAFIAYDLLAPSPQFRLVRREVMDNERMHVSITPVRNLFRLCNEPQY